MSHHIFIHSHAFTRPNKQFVLISMVPGNTASVMSLTQECEPFARELAAHLETLGTPRSEREAGHHSGLLLRGRQALIFGAGASGKIVKFVGRQHTEQKLEVMQRPFVDSCRREVDFFRSLENSRAAVGDLVMEGGRQGGRESASSALASLFPQVEILKSHLATKCTR